MTTPWAAGPVFPKRLLLGVVVPVLYILALAITVVAASGGRDGHAPSASMTLVGVRAEPVAKPHTKPKHVVQRTEPKPFTRPLHRVTTVAMRPPVQHHVEPVVSRSAYRPVIEESPSVALVVRVASVTTPATMQAAINQCHGPVEIDWGFLPTEIAEHDYCGGSAFSALSAGQQVQVVGGSMAGRYVVNGQRRFAAAGSSAYQLDGLGDLALQTCVSGGVILVGLDRVG